MLIGMELNKQLFSLMGADANTAKWLITLASICAEKLVFIIPILLLALWLWGNHNDRVLVLKSTLVICLALLIGFFIGRIYPYPRPFMINLGPNFLEHRSNASFPSNHMTFISACFISFLCNKQKFLGLVILVIALLTAWARVYLAAHFPLDMLGGIIVAGLSYLLILPIWKLLGDKLLELFEIIYRKIFAKLIAKQWISN